MSLLKVPNLRLLNNSKGQMIVEYVLLLVVAIAIAAILTRGLVSRNADEPGVIINAWNNMIHAIGNDYSDSVRQTDK